MKFSKNRYHDRWHEDGPSYRFRDRRTIRRAERDLVRLAFE